VNIRTRVLLAAAAAGVTQAFTGVAMYVAGVYFAPWSMAVSVAVLALCILLGGMWCLKGESVVSYRQALAAGVAISLGTGLVYALYNVITIRWFYPAFLDQVASAQLAQLQGRGPTPMSFEAVRVSLTASRLALSNLIRLSVIGCVLSLPIALLHRRWSSTSENPAGAARAGAA
jgi:hypothetical protein